jgi:hypothetical protein
MGVHHRHACWALGLIAALAGAPAAETSAPGWARYRSDKFGYALSYPPEVHLEVHLDGVSAELRATRTNAPLAEFEVWPPDECPRQPRGLTAKTLGIERVTTATQADGPDGSSWCGEPVTLRERSSAHGVPIFEVDLTCRSERVTVSKGGPDGGKPVVTMEGKKGPTFFADISVPWRKRILYADPVGIDPRMSPPRQPPRPALVLEVLETLQTVPTTDPHTICIEDLQGRGVTAARPAPAHPR